MGRIEALLLGLNVLELVSAPLRSRLGKVLALANHVALLQRGRLIFQGARPAEMVSDPTWLYRTYGED